MRSHIDLAQGDLLAPPAAPREHRLTTRQLCEIQEATEAANCAAAARRKDSPYCSLSFAWNGSGYHGYVRHDALGWITFAHAVIRVSEAGMSVSLALVVELCSVRREGPPAVFPIRIQVVQ